MIETFSARVFKKEDGYLEERDMRGWVRRVQLLIYLVSFLDALIIGVAIYFILRTLGVNWPISLISGVISFAIVFPAIMVIDVSISAFDSSNFTHTTAEAITGKGNQILNTLKTVWNKMRNSFLIVLFIRILLYFIVFLVSYQSLKFVFNELLRETNRSALSQLNDNRETDFRKRVDSLDREMSRIEAQLVKEASGTGPSGIRGIGPTYKTLLQSKERVQLEKDSVIRGKRNSINIDSLSKLPPRELIEKFPGSRIIDPPKIKIPFQDFFFGKGDVYFHELIASVLSLILFLSIIILKITGGERINKIYYNSALQDLYRDYLNNQLHQQHIKEIRDYCEVLKDGYLPSAESFYRWFVHQYPITEAELISDMWMRIQDEKITYLDKVIKEIDERRRSTTSETEVYSEALKLNDERAFSLEEQLRLKAAVLNQLNAGIESIEEAIKAPVDAQFIVNLTHSQNFQKAQRDSLERELSANRAGINAIALDKISIEDKQKLVVSLRKSDEELYIAMVKLRQTVQLLFSKGKLMILKGDDGAKSYKELIGSVVDFLTELIQKFGSFD